MRRALGNRKMEMLLLDVQQPSTVGKLHEVRQKDCMAQETSRMANSILGRLCFSRVNWHF